MSIETIEQNKSKIDGAQFIHGDQGDDWYIRSSFNDNLYTELSWELWVALTKEIIIKDKRRRKLGVKFNRLFLMSGRYCSIDLEGGG